MLAALVLIGLVLGVVIFLNWDKICDLDLGSQAPPTPDPDLKCPDEREGDSRSERHADPGSLEELSAAIEAGAGMPAVARAAGRALDASVALIDRAEQRARRRRRLP